MTGPDRRREIATGLFVFLLLFGGFGFGELTLRLINYERYGTMRITDFVNPDASAGLLSVDPATGIERPSPGFSGGGIHINQLGFRGPPLDIPKPSSRIRLAFV